MTDIARMESALKNAHAAGDVQAAKAIANALKSAQQAPQANNELSAMSQSMSAPKSDVDRQVRASMEASKLEGMRLKRLPGSGVMDQITSGMMFGLDDELGGVIGAPFRAIRDQVGLKEAYGREAALLREQKRRNREKTGAIGTGAEIAGSLMTGGALSKIGPMAASAGRGLAARIGAGAAEGAAYGAVSGAGNADGSLSDAKQGAMSGATVGAALGGAIPIVGAGARKAFEGVRQSRASNAFSKAAPMADDLAAQESALFDAARQSGVSVKPKAMDRLIDNMTLAAGRRNDALRAKTAGMLDELQAMRGQKVDVQSLHELRQEVGAAMSSADPQDVRTLTRMKQVLDGFIDNADASKIDGGVEGLKTLRQALDVSARRFKTEKIEQLLDLADVRTGQYSQSGAVNALRAEASKLYKQISSGRAKGFTAEETALIRSLAKVETQSAANKILSKFAPRGVVSTGMGAIAGAATMGPVGAAIPMVLGGAAARGADKGALQAAQTLRAMAATGQAAPKAAPLLSSRLSPRLVQGAGATGGLLSSQ